MRLAVLADVHGNSIALDAVLEDIRSRGGVHGYLLLGDFAAIGPDPVGVVERITGLAGARFVQRLQGRAARDTRGRGAAGDVESDGRIIGSRRSADGSAARGAVPHGPPAARGRAERGLLNRTNEKPCRGCCHPHATVPRCRSLASQTTEQSPLRVPPPPAHTQNVRFVYAQVGRG